MIDYLNGIFAKAGIPLSPFDRETGISENDLNGIHVSLTYSKDLKSLLVSGVIIAFCLFPKDTQSRKVKIIVSTAVICAVATGALIPLVIVC